MNRVQLEHARRGVDLLLGHLNGTDDSLDKAVADENLEACKEAADPLMTVATILIRKLRTATGGTVESALDQTRPHVTQNAPPEHLANVEQHIADLVLGDKPRRISSTSVMVAAISQEVAIGAAEELGRIQNKHPNAIVAHLRSELKSHSDKIQISDPESAAKVAARYAAQTEMQASRERTASKLADYLTDAGFKLHEAGRQNGITADCHDALEGLALITVTAGSLATGIWQLASARNLYPAYALLRQLVECEFISWKFAQNIQEAENWLHSTSEQRRESWRPFTIYRNDNNEFRQKDYAGHCENGGHPTPRGARTAAGSIDLTINMANLLSDMIGHSKDAWRHILESVAAIDREFSMDVSSALDEIGSGFTATWNNWSETDMFRFAITPFFDPTP